MKNLLKCLGQWIFKHKKGLVYGVLGLFVGQVVFFGLGGMGSESTVFAADNSATQSVNFQEKVNGWYEETSAIKKIIDVIIYPLLVVAGMLVDNTLVYGEAFSFDVVLWNLWNIVKNLANLALGCVVLYHIFRFMIGKSEKDMSVKDIILRGLIAGVGIQASWFALAVLIDISSILTYSVGGLPITVLGANDMELDYNPYMLKYVESQDANDLKVINKYRTNPSSGDKMGDFYISECEIFNYDDQSVILAPKMIYYISKDKKIKETLSTSCFVDNNVYLFSSLYGVLGQYFGDCGDPETCRNLQISYQAAMEASKKEIIGEKKAPDLVSNAVLMQEGNAHEKDGVYGNLSSALYPDNRGLDVNNKQTGETWGLSKLQDILEGKSYIGIFATLYSSLMNRGSFIPPDIGAYGAFLSSLLALLHTLAVAIPLIAASLVFMMRIGVLWVAIVLSPFIVLFKCFDLYKNFFGKGNESKILSYLKLENLIPIIFSPAVICFAISLSTVLVTIISNQNMKTNEISGEILGGLISLDMAGTGVFLGKLITSIIGIAITWFLVWTAVQTNSLGKGSLISGLKGLATSALGNMPIIPVPGKDWKGVDFMGVSTVFGEGNSGGVISKITGELKDKMSGNSNETVNEWVKRIDDSLNNKDDFSREITQRKLDAYGNKLVNLPVGEITDNWTTKEIFIGEGSNKKPMTFDTDLDNAGKKQIIEKINNITDDNIRKAFGKVGSVKVGDKVYNFDNTENKYK